MTTDLPAASSSTEVNALADQLAAEMRRRWQDGNRPLAEEFISEHPVLAEHPGAVGELIYEEVSLRRERGEPGGSSEVLRRFPQWAAPLRVMLDLRDALEADGEPEFPVAGDHLGEFQLLAELGRGRRGRVFLARQPALADRPVVVKITPRLDAEHLSLARLQHTHIVPLYAVHDDQDRRLRMLCMPYFGGSTLAQVLERIGRIPPANRTPVDLWTAIQSSESSPPLPPRWASSDWVRIVTYFGASLADALQFAHERDLVHMDVKPSNILLTSDGEPMLLDFHLARPPVSAGGPLPAWLGGTPGYLSPEQSEALEAVRSGRPLTEPVEGRSDVFSLGSVLYESLAGGRPDGRSLAARNNRVSVGLSDVVARCLANNPDDRYSDAAALAADLRRHLSNLPLRGVRNRSPRERWRKWRHRRPHALSIVSVLALMLLAGALAAGFIGHRREQARAALAEGNAELERGNFVEARGAFRRGLAVAEDLPLRGTLADDLTRGLARADRAAAARELHTVAEGLRAFSVADDVPANVLQAADRLGRQLWARRAELFALTTADLPATVRDQARADLLDVILVWSRVRVGLAQADGQAMLDVLNEVERELGPCVGLYLARANLFRDLGRPLDGDADLRRAAETPPMSAWDHIVLGTHHLRLGEHDLARTQFERAVSRDPKSFWPRLYLGRCDLARGQPDEALLAFAVCTGLEPDNAIGHLHKALAHSRLGQREKALADVDRTLSLDPGNSQALALRAAVLRMD